MTVLSFDFIGAVYVWINVSDSEKYISSNWQYQLIVEHYC